MEFVYALAIAYINYLVIAQRKKWLNYLSLFSLIWLLMIVFSKLHLFGLAESSEKAYFIVCIGGLFFSLFYLVGTNLRINLVIKKQAEGQACIKDRETDWINYRVYWVLFILVSAFQMIFLIRAMALLLGGGNLQVIHRAIRDAEGAGIIQTKIERMVNNILVQPFIFAAIPISLIAAFKRVKYSVWILVSSIFLSLSYFITHAGRIIIIDYIIYIMFILQIQNITVSKGLRRKILFVVTVMAMSIVLITASRRGLSFSREYLQDSFVREVYDYFAIPLPQLSYWINNIDTSGFHSYGIAFLNGFIELPLQVLERMGIELTGYLGIVDRINEVELVYTRAAYADITYNAFVTPFYFFYVDFRYIGVVLGSSLFGMISGIIDERAKRNTIMNLALYLMFLQSIIRVFARWQFYKTNYVLSFLLIFIICHRFIHARREGGISRDA